MRTGADPQRAADVADAMRELARTGFLPDEQRSYAAQDRPLPLWHGQTSSQPSTVATMLRLLRGAGRRARARRRRRVRLDDGAARAARRPAAAASSGSSSTRELARWGADEPRRAATCRGPRIEPAVPGVARPSGRRRMAPDPGLRRAALDARTSWSTSSTTDGGRMVIPVRSTLQVVVRTGARRTTVSVARLLPLRAPALSRSRAAPGDADRTNHPNVWRIG